MNEPWLEELTREPELPDDGFSAMVMKRVRRERLLRSWVLSCVGGLGFVLGALFLPWDFFSWDHIFPLASQAVQAVSVPKISVPNLPVPNIDPLYVLAFLVALGTGGAFWIDTEPAFGR